MQNSIRQSSNVAARRKQGETTGSLLRRFTQYVRKSGLLANVRAHRYFAKDQTKRARRRSALVRVERKKEYERMRKLGIGPERSPFVRK